MHLAYLHPGGGGGVLGIYIGGGVPWHTKKGGGLRCGHSPKRGVLGVGTAPKNGGLRCGHNQKKWVLGTSTTRKKWGIYNWFCKKRGSYELKLLKGGFWELIYLLSSLLLVNMINWRGVFWQAEKKGGGS